MYKSLIYSWFLWYSIAGKFQEMKFSRISKFLFNSYYSSLFSIFELSFQVYTSHIIPRVYQIRPMSYSTVAANFTWSHPVMYLRACIIDTQHGRSQLCVYGNATLSGCWINYITYHPQFLTLTKNLRIIFMRLKNLKILKNWSPQYCLVIWYPFSFILFRCALYWSMSVYVCLSTQSHMTSTFLL